MEFTLKPDRRRYLLLLIPSAGFVVSGVFMVRAADPIGWAVVLLFGAGVVVFCLTLLPGSAYLRLDPAGFTVCTLYRAHSTRWFEVESFNVARIGSRKMVVFNFSDLHPGQEFVRKLSSAVSGYEAALPETYGLSAEELAAIMNDWRGREGPLTVP
jgi:hypothetical protein